VAKIALKAPSSVPNFASPDIYKQKGFIIKTNLFILTKRNAENYLLDKDVGHPLSLCYYPPFDFHHFGPDAIKYIIIKFIYIK
jgi:hypothetical protein